MKKFSSTYGGLKDNFVIIGNFSEEKPSVKVLSVLSVVQNILQRGSKEHPTKPSEYLKSVLGELQEKATFLLSHELAQWSNIKGDTENVDYPACTFFEELIPKYWKGCSVARNLIIPEAGFKDILGYSTELDEQQVDFYLPQLRLVLEIDGSSHYTQSQQQKDRIRDRALRQNKIRTLRIKTGDIRDETQMLSNVLSSLYEEIKENADINEYLKSLNVQNDDIRVQYDTVMRLQMTIIELIKCSIWKVDTDTVSVGFANCDVVNIEKLLEYAYNDICLWVKNILQLLDFEFKMPQLSIVEKAKDADVIIDYSVYKRWTDSDLSQEEKYVCIRNDYYYKDNFYKVASADTLKYNLNTLKLSDNCTSALNFFLKNIFGFDEFNDGQLQIISNILSGNDTIGILPTGSGKSLCYQLAALLQPGVAVVVVPIIALMQDQKKIMDKIGVAQVANISSQILKEERERVLKDFKLGKYQIMLVSPERFQDETFRQSLQEININLNFSLAVIDEVHCMSEWGHDFRVSYLSLIPTITEYCPEAKILGLTATASASVLKDLKAEFRMQDSSNVKALASMNRDELVFKKVICHSQTDKEEVIKQIIEERCGTYKDSDGVVKPSVGIVFCPKVNGSHVTSCIKAQEYLGTKVMEKEKVKIYHGQLDVNKRQVAQEEFMKDDFAGVMVCTKAFGMGIDKPNIKFTMHTCLPQSMEAFYQEAGRAGRDKKSKTTKSYCYILYMPEEEKKLTTVRDIFNPHTDVDKRKNLSKWLSFNGDLNTIMFFWNLGRQNIDEEYENIKYVLFKLYEKENTDVTLRFDDTNESMDATKKGKIPPHGLQRTQEALYKLAILGIVGTWTITYDTLKRGSIVVQYKDLDTKRVCDNLEKHIRKYDPTFKLEELEETDVYKTTLRKNPKKPIMACIRKLVDWTNNNVIYARLRSLQTILEACSDDVSDETFRQRLNGYFAYTDDTIKFDNLQLYPHNYKLWFDVLQNIDRQGNCNFITRNQAEELLAPLARYLESYANNTAFNYLSGMLRLMCGTFENSEGEWRLKESLQDAVKHFNETDQKEVFDKTLDIIETLDFDAQNMASSVLCEVFKDKIYVIHERLQDMASLTKIIDLGTQKIQNSMEV